MAHSKHPLRSVPPRHRFGKQLFTTDLEWHRHAVEDAMSGGGTLSCDGDDDNLVRAPCDKVIGDLYVEVRHHGQTYRASIAHPDLARRQIRFPINESTDDLSQIQECLREYKCEGTQFITIASEDFYGGTDKRA